MFISTFKCKYCPNISNISNIIKQTQIENNNPAKKSALVVFLLFETTRAKSYLPLDQTAIIPAAEQKNVKYPKSDGLYSLVIIGLIANNNICAMAVVEINLITILFLYNLFNT